MKVNDLISNFLELSVEVDREAKEFLPLSPVQINWRPSEKQWSIGECFEHLLRTNKEYVYQFQNYSTSGRIKNIEGDYKHSFTGRLLIRAVKPGNRKMKTPASFNPLGNNIKEDIVKDFLVQNNLIADLSRNLDSSKLKLKIRSPFYSFVKYEIGDALMIIAYHNLRHIRQAKKVMQNESFP